MLRRAFAARSSRSTRHRQQVAGHAGDALSSSRMSHSIGLGTGLPQDGTTRCDTVVGGGISCYAALQVRQAGAHMWRPLSNLMTASSVRPWSERSSFCLSIISVQSERTLSAIASLPQTWISASSSVATSVA